MFSLNGDHFTETPARKWTATIEWGDGGKSSKARLVYNRKTKMWDVIASHTYRRAGDYEPILKLISVVSRRAQMG